MTQEKQVSNLIINKLTKEQYQQLVITEQVSNTELYLVDEDEPISGVKVTMRIW